MHRTVTPTDHAPANEAPRADPPAAVGAPRTTAPRYWCFISYRHANNQSADRRWATWLHQEIERYEVPAELVGRPSKWGRVVPERIYPVFRDEESAPADPELSVAIERALDDSSVLLVLCSPGAVESGYVGEEIRRFATTGRADRIITAVIDGDPKDPNRQCFPQPLRDLWAAQPHSDSPRGLSVATGPLWADFRLRGTDGAFHEGFTSAEAYRRQLAADRTVSKQEAKKRADEYEYQLQLAKLKVIGGILGVPVEALVDRDKAHRLRHERQRSRVLRRWVAAVTLLATGMFSAFVVATRRGRQVRAELARALRLEAVRSIGQQEYGRSLAYLAASLRQNPEDRATIVRTVSLLADQTFALPLAVRQPFHPMPRDRRYCPAEDDAPSWSGRRIDESDAISSDATRYAWQDRSRRGTYRASAQCGGRDTATFAPGFSDAPGTRWHAQFDDRGRWLAIMATRRNGTEVGLWSVADLAHPVPAIAPIAVPEAAGARLVVNGAQDTLRYMDVQDAGSEATADGGEPRTSTRWNVREGRYIPQWREAPAAWSRGLGSRGNVAALNAALSRQGWSVKGEPKDEAPLVLVSPEGREEPLDLAGWSNTWAMDATDDGRVLAIGGEDHALHLWRVDRRELTAGPPLPHDAAVWRAHLSAAGDLVVTATGSGGMETPQSIRVWDAVTGDLLAGPWPAIGQVEACAFVRGGAVVRCGVPSERAGGGWTVAEWPIGAPGVRADAAALAALAEAVGGWRLTSERALVLVPVARRVAVLDSLRRDHAGGRPTALREFVAWFLADRNTRHAADALPR